MRAHISYSMRDFLARRQPSRKMADLKLVYGSKLPIMVDHKLVYGSKLLKISCPLHSLELILAHLKGIRHA